nr:hypothetical protein [Francisella halioticida]
MFKRILTILNISLIFCICNIAIASDVSQKEDSSLELSNQYSPNFIRALESNAFRRVFPNEDFIANIAPLSNRQQEKQQEKSAQQAIQDLAVKEGDGLTNSEKRAVAKKSIDNKINQALNYNPIKTSFFNGFRVSETLSYAMLNTQQDTSDPLFMLQARQQGILDDNYIYFGAKVSLLDWFRLNRIPPGGENQEFSYAVHAYAASTISKWFSALLGFTLYQDHGDGFNVTHDTIYLIEGNLSESPIFGYVANSTVMFGNFDIVSNYVPTLTRTYFMQAGGNINL